MIPIPQLPPLRAALGIARSLHLYYGGRDRRRRMDALHRRFLDPGDLAFDVGAHVGDRTGSFRRIGARVVAIEPQPGLLRVLRLIYGRDPSVAIESCAAGRVEGAVDLRLNPGNPTVATVSEAFVAAARGAPGWEDQHWTATICVPVTTLDALIARHGVPAFVKIDVEGYEAEALSGLSHGVEALSFEFTTIQRRAAVEALERIVRLGRYRFNAALGESQTLVHPRPLDAEGIARWIEDLPHAANSGDVYAAHAEESLTP